VPVARDGAPHYPHALNGLARSRSASPDRDIANALNNNPQRTPTDAKQKGRFAERSSSAGSGTRRRGLWASTPPKQAGKLVPVLPVVVPAFCDRARTQCPLPYGHPYSLIPLRTQADVLDLQVEEHPPLPYVEPYAGACAGLRSLDFRARQMSSRPRLAYRRSSGFEFKTLERVLV
jgi:hypothetical protein